MLLAVSANCKEPYFLCENTTCSCNLDQLPPKQGLDFSQFFSQWISVANDDTLALFHRRLNFPRSPCTSERCLTGAAAKGSTYVYVLVSDVAISEFSLLRKEHLFIAGSIQHHRNKASTSHSRARPGTTTASRSSTSVTHCSDAYSPLKSRRLPMRLLHLARRAIQILVAKPKFLGSPVRECNFNVLLAFW